MKKQFVRNEHGVAIRMCCASCKMRRLTSDDSRVCKLTGRIVTRTRLCKQWVLAPRLQSAGRSGGRIKSRQYLSYYRERWSAQREAVEAGRIAVEELLSADDIRREFEAQFGSIYINF